MPNFAGYVGPTFTGLEEDLANRAYAPGLSSSLGTPPQWTAVTAVDETDLEALDTAILAGVEAEGTFTAAPTDYDGEIPREPGDDWFEKIILLPRRFDFGIILAVQQKVIDLYNSYREATRDLNSYVNDAGDGVIITNLPSLPAELGPQEGLLLNLQVTLDGPPTIDGTLDFGFDVYTVYLPLTGQRAVIFPFTPLSPFIETLRFQTNVIAHRDGTEQRIILRDTPRQMFAATYSLEGHEKRLFANIVFDSQARAVGLPMWHEPSILQAPIAVSDTTVTVDTTNYADWRADGLGIVFQDAENFEALTVDSFTSTTVTFSSPFTKTFSPGAYVMPVRTAYMQQLISGSRTPVNLRDWKLMFTVLDNSVDLSSVAAFGSYNSKVFLDEPNAISGSLEESMERRMDVVDGETGTFEITSPWAVSRRGARKTFFSNTRKRLWEVRQLLHALKGRAKSWYIPTFTDDIEPTAGIAAGSAGLTIKNIGYTNHVKDQQPKDVIQVILTDGTKLIRGVVSSSEGSPTEETLTVDSTWGVTAALSEIDRVEFVEKTRFDSDDITIEHRGAIGDALIYAPTKAVLE
jgi:hypothetical protein